MIKEGCTCDALFERHGAGGGAMGCPGGGAGGGGGGGGYDKNEMLSDIGSRG